MLDQFNCGGAENNYNCSNKKKNNTQLCVASNQDNYENWQFLQQQIMINVVASREVSAA